jgi:hypothetical protein
LPSFFSSLFSFFFSFFSFAFSFFSLVSVLVFLVTLIFFKLSSTFLGGSPPSGFAASAALSTLSAVAVNSALMASRA